MRDGNLNGEALKDAVSIKSRGRGKQTISIQAIDIRSMNLKLIGVTPLVVHKFSEKAKKIMADKQQGRGVQKKAAKDAKADFEAAMYRLPKGGHGFKAVAFKASAISSCRFTEGISMKIAKGAFHIIGDILRLDFDKVVMREDAVRLATGVCDLRYRPEYQGWSVVLPIKFNANVITPEQIVNLFQLAGFHVGVGEMRPMPRQSESSGSFGMFEVAKTKGE